MESDRREEETKEENKEEIEEEESSENANPNPNPNPRSVTTKVPEVEVHLYRSGKGPIDVFRSSLGGWDQDRLEVQDILEKYGFKSVFAFNTESGRGVSIRFSARNGRSILPYRDGSVIYVDGEPKKLDMAERIADQASNPGIQWPLNGGNSVETSESGHSNRPLEQRHVSRLLDPMLKPITKIIIGVAVITLLIAIFVKETPQWFSKFTANTFPPWVIACMVIAFTRLRKRTKNLLKKFGW